MKTYTTREKYLKYILQDSLYLVDQNIRKFVGTRPQKYFVTLSDVMPIDSEDDYILDYSIRHNLINVTNDIKFTIQNLLKSRNVIYQTNKTNKRFYFVLKKLEILQNSKLTLKEKLFETITGKNNKISYIADNSKSLSRINFEQIPKIDQKINNLDYFTDKIRFDIILDYIESSKSVLVTSSKHNFIKTLFRLKECVYVDSEFVPHYLQIDYFEFDIVSYDRKANAIRNLENPTYDDLFNNIRFIRNYIDVIEKNLNYIESQLIQRKELEALRELEPLQVPTSNPTKGIDILE